ncbi:calcium-binding protein [Candidatus Nitrosocaldus cavascurensis]|uniref:Uncharacterized protein n=1 Tax=Candidatus Nitrosocaldus cavascurensis TaxID=2058097 RepID=A0A2K5ARG3_9ARCH|nr:calcium-binding protein [Candidatus Nitrosocaldus cavascurensis]SPC34215.1 conserved protein of unknown function [Candidatus Nitrosocaldus cavascurensis]
MAENGGITRAEKRVTSATAITITITTILLLMVVSMTVTDGIRTVYAQSATITAECNGHTIERGNFDADGDDEVKVDGTVYNDGDTITLPSGTYTIRIATPSWPTPYNGTDDNDFIVGTSGDDYIFGRGEDDFIVGFGGNDYLYGDVVKGTDGADTLEGGDDILCGNDGDDYLYGDVIGGGNGNDTMTGGNDTLYGGKGNDNLFGDGIGGAYGDDTLTGGDDTLYGGEGDDWLEGDVIGGGDGDNTMTGGNDTLYGGKGSDRLYGDGIWGEDGDNTMTGGNDTLYGGKGSDRLYGDGIGGGVGNDTLTGGDDTLKGGDGDDYLYGDSIDGGPGVDKIQGGNDTLYGGKGNDKLFGDGIWGDADNDTAYGGNDVIDARDNVEDNDSIDGDYIILAESTTEGNQDICASDPEDTEVNCEYHDISGLATLTTDSATIPLGGSVQIIFNSSVDNPVKITNLRVITPTGNTCTYTGTLPIIVPSNPFTATYPDNFIDIDTGTDCDTSAVGEYTVVAETEVGDPITTNFNISFNVVPEAVVGAVGMVGTGFLSILLYRRLRGKSRKE